MNFYGWNLDSAEKITLKNVLTAFFGKKILFCFDEIGEIAVKNWNNFLLLQINRHFRLNDSILFHLNEIGQKNFLKA